MGTGGWRYGAGRPGWRGKCEHCLPLDIRRLKVYDCLRPGKWFSWQWSCDGKRTGSISASVSVDSLELSYTWTPRGGAARDMQMRVPLVRTGCRFGGSRLWFRCPWCNRRCAVLYGLSGDGYFGCRLCLRLAYVSEAEDAMGRLWRKQRKLEARLDGRGDKPKGMRWHTYERLYEKITAIEQTRDTEFLIRAAALLGRNRVTFDELLK